MTITKTDKLTRTVILTLFLFLVAFFALEYAFSLYFTGETSGVLEKERKIEFHQSWNQYMDQRKKVLITGLDGYANWSFLSDNILKGNNREIEDSFYDYVETLQKDYLFDFAMINGMNRQPVFSYYDHYTSKNDAQKIMSLRNKTFEDYAYKVMLKEYEAEKKKVEENPGSRSKVWCSLLLLNKEIFLIACSFIANDEGLLVSPDAIMVVGVRMSIIMELASGVIPAKFQIFSSPQNEKSYMDIIETGFFPGENFYVSLTPNFLMEDLIKKTISWSMIIQVLLFILLMLLTYPLSIKLYTRQLQEIIDLQTQELTTANVKQAKLIKHLQEAIASIRTLEGLIPICASCKKIRNDNGYWEQVEQYIQLHSSANFSHGICPECIKKLYPDVAAKMGKEKSDKKQNPFK